MKRRIVSGLAVLAFLAFGGVSMAQDQLSVTEIILGSALEAGVPTPAATTFSRSAGTIFCMARIANPSRTETAVHIAFERADGEPAARVAGNRLEVPAQPRYRTVARTGTSRTAGSYRCVVRAEDGTVLSHADFELTE